MNKEQEDKSKRIIIANWKMNLFYQPTKDLIARLKKDLDNYSQKVDIVVCPSFPYLEETYKFLKGSGIKLGAQDVFWEVEGNYTGEISPRMLKELGCQYVIIGHSERRKYLKETDEMVDRKTITALRNGLIPIICVGETKDERRQGVHYLVIADQVKKALRYLNPIFKNDKVIVAYEPVWSIYPGQPCEPEEARESAMVVKQTLIDLYPEEIVRNNFRIIYGGSINEKIVLNYIDDKNIQGVLVGSASLKSESFVKIIKKL